MSTEETVQSNAKPRWARPQLKKLGTLRDIAGYTGVGTQAGPNARASNHLS